MNELTREAIVMLRDAGYRPVVVMSRSPSDFRARAANRTLLRRMLRSTTEKPL